MLRLSIEEEPEGAQSESSHGVRPFLQCLSSIPPERVGIQGEYDHSGLAKRVRLALQQQFGEETIDQFVVSQRGRVVILEGSLNNQALLERMIGVALSVEGASFVEVYEPFLQEYA